MNPTLNPYAAPITEPAAVVRDAALYTPNHVALATFLGSPLAGAIVLAMNERRLGRSSGVGMVVYGVLGTAALLAISFAVPLPIGIAAIFVMRAIAHKHQGAAFAEHVGRGGKQASGWAAAGIGALSLLAIAVPLVTVLMLLDVS